MTDVHRPHNATFDWNDVPSSHLNSKGFELLSGSQIDDVLVNPATSLQEFLVQQVEDDLGLGLRVHRNAEVVRVPGRDANVTCVEE